MPDPQSPLKRSIGVVGVVRWLIVVMAVVATGEAFHEGRIGLGVGGLVVLLAAGAGAYWIWRSRQESRRGAG